MPQAARFGPCVGLLVAIAAAMTSCEEKSPPPPAAAVGWQEFEGTWSAVGDRRTIPLGGDRKGAIIDLRGTMLLSGSGRPGVGFRAEVVALADTQTGLVGRAVWTDERGDQVFSEISGEGTRETNRVAGTILGGTGRYGGVSGTYEFSWRFVIEAEDGSMQGRAEGFKGRVLLGGGAEGGSPK